MKKFTKRLFWLPWKIWMQSAVLMCWVIWIMWYVMESVRPGSILTKKYAQEIDEILKKVIAMGKGIELNTAGWKYGLAFCHPHPEILCRYKELGGEIITVGSDAHKPEHVAYDFQKAADVLKACGFKYYTEFQDRKPIFKQLL